MMKNVHKIIMQIVRDLNIHDVKDWNRRITEKVLKDYMIKKEDYNTKVISDLIAAVHAEGPLGRDGTRKVQERLARLMKEREMLIGEGRKAFNLSTLSYNNMIEALDNAIHALERHLRYFD